ncbi:MAG: thioredoxin family protein [Pseudomonadota bacterium]|nr:thioredoxin family protein [Pseudomonadota bacterium]
MVLTPSKMLQLGTRLPPFKLQDPETGKLLDASIIPATSKGVLVAVICNHCPYVVHIRDCFAALATEFTARGIYVMAVSANDAERYPEDSPANMRRDKTGFAFPYLYDEQQQFVKDLAAACTPDFFLFDAQRQLVYRGRFDGSRPHSEIPVTGEDLRAAMAALLNAEPISAEQLPSMGCNIKWREK